ncbi:hypothetical protein [Ornithinimicrobium kibberense]|uniref:hypothetical protein n=1 Tax=Ornithinimicrobium kibberense TaxID=282060 RepID=UPI0036155B6D
METLCRLSYGGGLSFLPANRPAGSDPQLYTTVPGSPKPDRPARSPARISRARRPGRWPREPR